MAIHNRPNPSDFFETSPSIDPDIGAKIDQELNALTSTVNSLDNENIDGDPKIDSSKIEFGEPGEAGYVLKTGDKMTGPLEHIFDGIWRIMRATGNARIREYRGEDGALWGLVYNTFWTGTSWAGRDVTGICMLIRIEVDGIAFYFAPSNSSGVVPSWTKIFGAGSDGKLQVKGNVQWFNLPPLVAGEQILDLNAPERTTTSATYVKLKETQIFRDGTLRIKFDMRSGDAYGAKGRIYRNDIAVGSERTAYESYITLTEDISDWISGDLVQIYGKKGDSNNVYIKNLALCANSLTGGVTNASY